MKPAIIDRIVATGVGSQISVGTPGTQLDLDAVDEKMTAARFTTEARITIKPMLGRVGQLALGRRFVE